MYILHRHTRIVHDGQVILGQDTCRTFHDHVDSEQRLAMMRREHEEMVANQPDGATITGNLLEGYAYTVLQESMCSHEITGTMRMFINQQECEQEAPPSEAQERVYAQVAAVLAEMEES